MTTYDDVIYPGQSYPDTHPEHLATIATLFGMTPAPPQRSRVLEVACGDGANLIPMAYTLPDSRFVGFDLAQRPIEMGKQWGARLGLGNLSLEWLDLGQFPPEAGQFDYIVAHGLYSWVPAEVRDKLLALLSAHLAPQGVAFVSYNTYPGCFVRRMLWEMLKFHTEMLDDPRARIAEAQALAGVLAVARSKDPYVTILQAEAGRLLERDPGLVFHDELSSVNEPVYFHQFVEHAAQHGLQFLSEAELQASGPSGLSPEQWQALEKLDVLTREQYLDFARCRRFRQTLLCHAAVELDRGLTPARMRSFRLRARGRMRVQEDGAAPAEAVETAPAADSAADAGLLQAVFDELNLVSPEALTMDQLVDRVLRRHSSALPGEQPSRLVERLVFGAVRGGAISLHVHTPSVALRPGEKPMASAVVRSQLQARSLVTNLHHESIQIDHAVGRQLLLLLDGTRGRAELLQHLGDSLGHDAAERERALEGCLDQLAKLALLVG